jgi:hypothetical protein
MSEPENFLERWSKRKIAERDRSSGDQTTTDKEIADDRAGDDNQVSGTAPPTRDLPAPLGSGETCDLTQLPSIDSIGASTDVTAFLRPGVPPELTRAALRRAWSSDPAIRDFVGLVENGWDFNDPSAMPGFGPISPQEVARLVTQLIGASGEAPSGEPPKQIEVSGHEVAAHEKSQLAQPNTPNAEPLESTSSAAQSDHGGDDAVQQSQDT